MLAPRVLLTPRVRPLDPDHARERLREARLLLLFTPELCGAGVDPLDVLEQVAGEVDLVQVRPKALAPESAAGVAAGPPGEARLAFDWTLRVLERLERVERPPLVMVNDRVDVALALAERGCAGVHVGRDDLPVAEARALLGPDLLLGLSTHDLREVAASAAWPVDLLGFGPAFPTTTKGYARGLGPELCWIASEASPAPLFAIGGVTVANAGELEPVGRAAVGSAVLCAADPAAAARALRAALAPTGG